MKFFGRHRPPNDDVRVGLLPALQPADAEWLIREVIAGLARRGVSVTDAGDGTLRGADGVKFGLDNLAIGLSHEKRRLWPAVVERHVAIMAAPAPEVPTDPADFARMVLPRLIAEAFSHAAVPSYAWEIGGGLSLIAALDFEDKVVMIGDADVFAAAGGWPALEDPAFANLRALPAPTHQELRADDEDPGTVVHAFEGEDFFVATRLVIVDELMAAAGQPTAGAPLLAAVPARDVLLVHPIESLSVITVAHYLGAVARGIFDDAPGSFSPFLYFRPADGPWQEVRTSVDRDSIVLHVEGRFADLVNSLGG